MSKKITDILPESLRAELSDDSLKAIQEAFDTAVETKVNERVNHAIKCAEANFDEASVKQTQEIMEMADLNHKLKTVKALNTLKEKYEERLEKVKAHYEKQLSEAADTFKTQLVSRIDKHIKEGVKRAVPTKQLRESLKNTLAIKTLKHMRDLLSVNESSVKAAYRPAILEAHKRITENAKRANLLEERNKTLIEENNELKAELYLAEKVKDMLPEAQSYMKRVMKGATKDFITENLESTYKMYQQARDAEREAIGRMTVEAHFNSGSRSKTSNLTRKDLVKKPRARVNESAGKSDIDVLLDIIERDENDI